MAKEFKSSFDRKKQAEDKNLKLAKKNDARFLRGWKPLKVSFEGRHRTAKF